MKKLIIVLFLTLLASTSFGQIKSQSVIMNDTVNVYKLYPTKNMWTFIKLNTSNGQMWQVQFAINVEGKRREEILSLSRLAYGNDAVSGRFELYPTENMYNFILLDQVDGRTWQVQWSFDYMNRGILPINDY
ncbi:MAG: hypothetical protein UHZ01_04710 [Prevotella sp.]|nr:hypothetical protein [Prevotella sp.]